MSEFGTFSVSSSLPDVAREMTATNTAIDEKLNNLERKLNDLRNTWTGGGFEAYEAKRKEWDNTVAVMTKELSSAVTTLTNAYESYQETDRSAASSFS